MLLEIGIEKFIGIEPRRVTGQIKDLDLVLILRQPLLNDLGVMHTKVVENEEYPLRRMARQAFEKVNQDAGIECARKDSPAHLPLVGHRGDHAQTGAIGFNSQHWCFSFRSITTAPNIVRSQSGFIAAMNLRTRVFGVFGDFRGLFIKPLAYRSRRLFIGFL